MTERGRTYGLHTSMLETPETKWGYPFVTENYKEDPSASWEKIMNQMRLHFPNAEEEPIKKVLGIRYPGTEEKKRPEKKKEKTERKYIRPQELPWPENLITEIGLQLVFGEDKYIPLSDDQMEGLRAALSDLRDKEKAVVCYRYEDHMILKEIAEKYGVRRERVRQIIAKGIKQLRHPSRLRYYQNGYRKTLELEKSRREKIRSGSDREEQIELLSEIGLRDAGFTARTQNCLIRAGLKNMGEIADILYIEPSRLLEIRNLGRGCMSEICLVMEEFGVDTSKARSFLGNENIT